MASGYHGSLLNLSFYVVLQIPLVNCLIITFNSNQNPLTCGPFIVSVFLVEEINDWKNALTKVTEMITKQFKFELKSET